MLRLGIYVSRWYDNALDENRVIFKYNNLIILKIFSWLGV